MYFKTVFDIPIILYSIGFTLKIRKGLTAKLLIIKTPTEKTLGMTSYCIDGNHVLFFDFDGNTLNEVIYQMNRLQEFYKLPPIYVFENDSENSFHCVCLAKVPLYKAIEIIIQTTADRSFKYAPLRYALKRWVLRVEKKGKRDKPKHLITIKPPNNKENYKKSNAHRLFLEFNYGIKIGKRGFDNEEELDCFDYHTANRIK